LSAEQPNEGHLGRLGQVGEQLDAVIEPLDEPVAMLASTGPESKLNETAL
jgi:hypothetical protein